jgi:hypothetical protein
MPDQEDEIQRLESQFPMLSGSAFAAEREKALRAGCTILESKDGVLYEVSPDGTRRFVKRLDPPTPVVPGTKLVIP